VDFGYTEEQVVISESARKFVEDRGRRKTAGDLDRDVWNGLADYGFLSVGLPERFGGIGGPVELSIVCRAFGAGPLVEPFVGAGILPAQILAEAGTEEQKSALLPAIALGRRVVSVAYRDAPEARRSARGRTSYRKQGDSYVLNGRKCLALGAPFADQLIVSAVPAGAGAGDDESLSLFLIDSRHRNLRLAPVPLVDGVACAEVYLDDVSVGEERLIGREHDGAAALRAALRYAMLASCSQTAGAMRKALQIASDYIKVRKQFGAALSSFQVLRHKVADMAIDCEMADAAILKMIASFQVPEQHDPDLASAIAKVLVDEAGHRVCGQAIQLHGGIGMTEECDVGRYFRHVTLNKALFGGPSGHLERYMNLLSARVESACAVQLRASGAESR
jgi:alkylation response protein AidB-like acyl-CoA dehydrogenase